MSTTTKVASMAAVCALIGCTANGETGSVGAAHAVVDAGPPPMDAGPPPPPPPGCTRTQGYWKNHPEDWYGVSLVLGGRTYTQAQLLALFDTPPRGDASIILAHQLIAALLNGGASDPSIVRAIAAAQEWLEDNADADGRLPYGISGGTAAHRTGTFIAGFLDAYNQGHIGPGHCEENGGPMLRRK